MKNVIILGSTGSIGTQTLEVIERTEGLRVLALACGKNIELLKKQIKKFNPKIICTDSFEDSKILKSEFPDIKTLTGAEGLLELADNKECDIFVVATSGVVSVRAVLRAIENKKRIALANKETLVMAGDIVMKKAKEYGCEILPIDSEHSAILQCLQGSNNPKRLWITASGGPFLNNTREEMARFSAKEALNHPRWAMGNKITIDCSTLVNKGLEVIEAHHLYNFDYENIKVLIHPQSLIHSLVEFVDGSHIAQLGLPSMHIPIQYALFYPERAEGIKTDSFDLFDKKLEFYKPDFEKFPLLKLTIDCGIKGGIMPAILNAANEVAVYKFLRGEINFLDIEKIVFSEVEEAKNIKNPSIDEIFEADRYIRNKLK
ncbi:MAG: 1-deoxy-D-xylulose-5-phosphate reductoisomerase [Candidatus Gastranaerophilales bacterium]|nr:1-deoxy-D-xylulose-5-phosphate reductoisomerase [Candidatus Gastranaerophilales bacterium]